MGTIQTVTAAATTTIQETLLDSYIELLTAEQKRQLEVLEVISEYTTHHTSFPSLGEYMEGMGDGFSITDSDADLESFSEVSLGLGEAWEYTPKGTRYSKSTEYPYPCILSDTTTDVLLIADSCFEQWTGRCLRLLDHYSSGSWTNGHDPKACLAVLDSLMCNINGGLLPTAKRFVMDVMGPDAPVDAMFAITEIRDAYLAACDNVLTPAHNSYWCNTGDAPVIFDRDYMYDVTERSEGGWSDIQPEDEVDFRLRNSLDTANVQAINLAEVEDKYYVRKDKDGNALLDKDGNPITEKDRGYEYTRYIMRQKEDRQNRADARMYTLLNSITLHGLAVHMLAIELEYKRSLYACEKLGNFNSIIITRAQLEAMRSTYENRRMRLLGDSKANLRPRTLYLLSAVELHQADKKAGEVKASQRIMTAYRRINRAAVGKKYFAKLVDIKDRMFKHILRNISAADKAAYKAKSYRSEPADMPTEMPEYMGIEYNHMVPDIFDGTIEEEMLTVVKA